MEPYSQRDHDEATEVGGIMLLLSFIPFVVALVAAFIFEVLA